MGVGLASSVGVVDHALVGWVAVSLVCDAEVGNLTDCSEAAAHGKVADLYGQVHAVDTGIPEVAKHALLELAQLRSEIFIRCALLEHFDLR